MRHIVTGHVRWGHVEGCFPLHAPVNVVILVHRHVARPKRRGRHSTPAQPLIVKMLRTKSGCSLRHCETPIPKRLKPPDTHRCQHRNLQAAQAAAALAETELNAAREHFDNAIAERNELAKNAAEARWKFEECERQTLNLSQDKAERELAKSRAALAELPPVPAVTPEQIARAEQALQDRSGELKACERSLNEVRGKLELVEGRAGVERIDDEQEAVGRAREHADDLELQYDASKHLLELLEAEETKRSSHLGRCLAAPVTERFLALTGDLYANVNLDPDLRLEGFGAS